MAERRVLVFGTFDGIHQGHEFFLRRARGQGTELYVCVARDVHVQMLKNKTPRLTQNVRIKNLERLGWIDKVLLCDEQLNDFHIVEDTKPDLIVLGHDQNALKEALVSWMEGSGTYIPMIHLQKFST